MIVRDKVTMPSKSQVVLTEARGAALPCSSTKINRETALLARNVLIRGSALQPILPAFMNRFGKLRLVALIAALFAGRTYADWSWQFPPQYVSATTAKRNNVFYVGETVAFTTGSAATRYEVRNYYGTLMDQGTISGQGTNITFPIHVQTPGWYKLYLYGSTDQGTPWGYVVGGSTFVIFRNDARFPSLPAPGSAAKTHLRTRLCAGSPAWGRNDILCRIATTLPTPLRSSTKTSLSMKRCTFPTIPCANAS